MTAFIAFVTANGALIAGAAVVLLNLLAAVLKNRANAVGIISAIIRVIQQLAVLEPKDSAGTVKLPGAKPKPVISDTK